MVSNTKFMAAGLGIALVVGGCGGGSPGGDVILRVVERNETVTDWTLSELEEVVGFVTMIIDGDEQRGPLLIDVLAASGADDWQSARVLGYGEGRAFQTALTLTAAEVGGGWILDVTNRGTLKLAADDLPRDRWVRDVGEIRVP